jgi:hypothetical protein
VIGKVVHGTHVEEIFAAGGQWQVRTPRGVFALPLTTSEFGQVTWGDADDLVVARPPSREAGDVVVYRIARKPGSSDFVTTGETPSLVLTEVDRATIPLHQSPLITTIDFAHTVTWRQQVGVYARTTVYSWHSIHPNGPNDGYYEVTSRSSTTPVFRTLHEQTIPYMATIPIALDGAHHRDFGTLREPYFWLFTDITANRDGRLLGLAVVLLSVPPGETVPVPIFGLQDDGTEQTQIATEAITPSFPDELLTLLWAIVDLKTGEIVVSTADPRIPMSSTLAREAPPWNNPYSAGGCCPPGLYVRDVQIFQGGPSEGTHESFGPASMSPRQTLEGHPSRCGVARAGRTSASRERFARTFVTPSCRPGSTISRSGS